MLLDNRTERIVASSKYSELAAVVLFLETELSHSGSEIPNRPNIKVDRRPASRAMQSLVVCHSCAGAILGPSLKRLCDLVTGQERAQQRRQMARIKALVTADNFFDRPPLVPKVVLNLEVHTF